MEFPVKVLTLSSVCCKEDPYNPLPAFEVFTVTKRLGETHAYVGHRGDDVDNVYYLHITEFIDLKPETDPNLFRRAVKRHGGAINQEYYTHRFNSLIAFQIKQRDDQLEFCLTSENAFNQAIVHEDQGLKYLADEYLRYAEILERFERLIDDYATNVDYKL